MRRRGFTLIELMMAMVILSLLMAIVVPLYRRMRDRGYTATLKADLRNLAVMEESYFYDYQVYTPSVAVLAQRGYRVSAGVQLQVYEATTIGWSATAVHAATVTQCHLFVGSAAPVGSATEAGKVACDG